MRAVILLLFDYDTAGLPRGLTVFPGPQCLFSAMPVAYISRVHAL